MDGEIICLETWKREKEEKQLEELTSLQEEISKTSENTTNQTEEVGTIEEKLQSYAKIQRILTCARGVLVTIYYDMLS